MNITIQKGIPIPPRFQTKWHTILDGMDPGDSLLVDSNHQRTQVLRCALHHGIPVTSRKIDGQGFRIWKLPT